jgi:hypothetical protein
VDIRTGKGEQVTPPRQAHLKVRLEPLVPCPGLRGARCQERSLVEPGRLCAPCCSVQNRIDAEAKTRKEEARD